MKWEMRRTRNEKWREYRLLLDGEEVAFAKWAPVCEDSVEMHNTFSRSSKSILVKARECFQTEIRSDIREAGYERIVAIFPFDLNADKAFRYLKVMGFEFFSGLMEA